MVAWINFVGDFEKKKQEPFRLYWRLFCLRIYMITFLGENVTTLENNTQLSIEILKSTWIAMQ